jgi:hypothetical protein
VPGQRLTLSTWWGWGSLASIALSVVLAFFFGYPTKRPRRRPFPGAPAEE